MDQISYKTTYVNKATAKKEWIVIDAENQVVGRLAAKVAKLLRGKYKPSYTPHVDWVYNVIIINALKIVLNGKKMTDKIYRRHTQYPGGQRTTTPAELMKRFPERILKHAIVGMLPKNRLGRAVAKNLYIYVGTEHKHQAQQPKLIDVNVIK